ncbi:putative caffeate O-methyltransferase [Helianthus annuus]|nr:putative caffeate O-methyltransferase [Helianthus annuus]
MRAGMECHKLLTTNKNSDKSCVKMGSEDNFTYAMELIHATTLSMVLVNTVKLKVLETIAKVGSDARLSARDIASRLSIPNQDAPDMIDRMLRLLATHSIVTCTEGVHESKPVRVYGLTPVGKYFIPNEEGISLGPFAQLIQDKVFVDSWFELEDAVLNGGVPFDKVHGAHSFEYPALDARFNKVFNQAMLNHTTILMKEILEHYRGFDNLERVVDVGGGLGHTLAMIISKHPNIKGINFDLPHVTQQAQLYEGIDHVGGDMFKEVPEGDTIFMKWILHDWSDDHCIKLLKNCYKALPKNGKVIIIEAILPFLPDTSSNVKVNTHMDVLMMTQNTGGKERTEDEFLALAKSAGFKGIKKECFLRNFWVMEFYKYIYIYIYI